jgi:hypothetical protein
MMIKILWICCVLFAPGFRVFLGQVSAKMDAIEADRCKQSEVLCAQQENQHSSPVAEKSSSADKSETNVPLGYSTERTGTMHDFDYFVGGWTTQQRRLKARAVGSNDWEEFSGNLCMSEYLGGMVTVDELYFPAKGTAGLTLRTFDKEKRQWAIYWVSSSTGKLDPVPTVGGFEGDRGEFYAEDEDEGRPIKVRYLWKKIDHDHARWEQAFSYDSHTWETNWTADFTRADSTIVCEGGRPKR